MTPNKHTLKSLLTRVQEAEVRLCAHCGKPFTKHVKASKDRWSKQRFCSQSCGGKASGNTKPRTLEELRTALLERTKVTGECWVCLGPGKWDGYGTITWRGRPWTTHRASYTAFIGPIPRGKHVLHSCDNRRCINPKHLRLGTNADNVRDRNARGRQARGSKIVTAKLKEADIHAIRASHERNAVLADRHNVSTSTIRSVRNLRTWSHV